MTLNVRYREELVVNHADILMAIVVNIIMLWNSRKFKRSRASESKMRQEIGHMLHLNGSRRGIFLGALALYKTYCSFSKYPVWYFQNDFIKKLNILPRIPRHMNVWWLLLPHNVCEPATASISHTHRGQRSYVMETENQNVFQRCDHRSSKSIYIIIRGWQIRVLKDSKNIQEKKTFPHWIKANLTCYTNNNTSQSSFLMNNRMKTHLDQGLLQHRADIKGGLGTACTLGHSSSQSSKYHYIGSDSYSVSHVI